MAKIAALFLIVSLLLGCGNSSIQITGNIPEEQILNKSGNFSELLSSLQIPAEYILVIASDGTSFFVSEKSFSEFEIEKKNGKFNSVSSTLPPVCNLKNIIEICVYRSDFHPANHQTPFSKKMAQFDFLGQSSRNGHFVRKYKLKEN